MRRAGIPPTPRCGFSTAVHKRRNLVVFGGVYDQYDKHDLVSTFYNDVYVFRMVPPLPLPAKALAHLRTCAAPAKYSQPS